MSAGSQLRAAPRSLSAIWDEIEANLQIKMPSLQLPVPQMGYGRDQLVHLKTPPSVIAIPGRGTARMTEERRGDGVDVAWKIWGREVVLEIHVWDVDETATEILANHVVASIHDVAAGYYAMIGEEWGDSKDTAFGDSVTIGARFYTNWSREFIPAVLPTSMEITGSITPPTS